MDSCTGAQVIVDGMRVRVRLDQQRIASLLAGISPDSMGDQFADVASGVLSMLGDMASLSFARYHTGKYLSLLHMSTTHLLTQSQLCCPPRLNAAICMVSCQSRISRGSPRTAAATLQATMLPCWCLRCARELHKSVNVCDFWVLSLQLTAMLLLLVAAEAHPD